MGQAWSGTYPSNAQQQDANRTVIVSESAARDALIAATMSRVDPNPEPTRAPTSSSTAEGKQPVQGLSRKNTTRAVKKSDEGPDDRKPPNARTMTRIVTFFKVKEGEGNGTDQPEQPPPSNPKPQKSATAKTNKSTKSTKSVKAKAAQPSNEDVTVQAEGAGSTDSAGPAADASAEDIPLPDDTDNEVNDSADDADDETDEAADDDAAAEGTGDEVPELGGPAEIVAPIPVSAGARNLVTLLTDAIEAVPGVDDDVPLIGGKPLPNKHHAAVRKARNAALPCVLLKVLVGRELAQPTKDALRVLAEGQALALPGEEVEFVRTIVEVDA